jgi:predicted Zn finger-like uncharacterized protein
MPIKVECSGCGATLRVPDEMLGRKVRCPKCDNTFTAAEPESAPPPPPPPREERRDEPPPPPLRSGSRDYDDDRDSGPGSGSRGKSDDDRDRDRDRDSGSPSRSRGRNYDDDPDEGSSRRSSRRDDDDDDRRSLRRRDDDDFDVRRSSRRGDDDEDYPRSSRGRGARGGGGAKPSPVQTAGILMLIGGILACLVALGLAASCYGLLWPGTYYSAVVGIMAIIRASQLMGDNAYQAGPGRGIAIMMIINILNCDVFTMTLGIIALVMLNNEESCRYFGE